MSEGIAAAPRSLHPIDNIEWVDVDLLSANSWNPNVVYSQEMRLLEFSILTTGWIQPVLISHDMVIIDGFHRVTLTKTSKAIRALTDGKVPCAILHISEAERMLLTVRINRAKGSHIALKMHELVGRLVGEHGISPEHVAKSIGATKDEVELLLQEGIFKALKIEDHRYSKAWVPK